jgi:hypothetical protein
MAIGYYGYVGDSGSDSNSLAGIGDTPDTEEAGSLNKLFEAGKNPAALKISAAVKRGLHPKDGRPSGESFVGDDGRTYVWVDRVPDDSPTNDNYIDKFQPDHPPDKGVSAEHITRDQKWASGNPAHSAVLPPSEATFKRQNPAPEGAVHKRVATQDELDAANQAEAEQQQPTTEEPSEEPEQPQAQAQRETPTPQSQPEVAAPGGAQPVAPVPKAIVDASQDPNQTFDAHSAALDPTDQRVTRRINPDTGSNKLVGQYFVPGDPVHEKYFLSGLNPEDRAKLPWISNAIGQGGPFSYLYDSAEQYKPGGKVTGQSRAMEQAASTAQQRISGEHEAQMQRVTMLPMQMMATEPKQDEEGNTIPSNLLLEGFGSDAVMNNASHLFNYARKGDIPVPYSGPNDFNFQKDVSGYLHNQANGFRGDGSPMLDENGQPHPLHVANQQKPVPYVPHLLDRPRAEFVHAMLNIRAPKNKKPPTAPPGFGERAAWQRRVNEGYAGQEAGVNNLLAKLDKQFPQVRVYRAKKNKETGEMEKYVHHHSPFSEASILEPTWRAYRLELMHHEMPPIGTQSLRGDVQAHLIHTAPEFKQTLATYRPHQGPGAAPISENPEVGAPLGAGKHIDPDRIRTRYKTDKIHWLPTSEIEQRWRTQDPGTYIGPGGAGNAIGDRYQGAMNYLGGDGPINAPEASIWDDGQVRFANGRHTFSAMRDFGHSQVPLALNKQSIKNAKKHGLIAQSGQPTPIGEDPQIGAPLGEGEKITHAAIRDKRTGKIYKGYNHQRAYDLARETDPSFSGWAPEEDEGFWTNQGKFYNRQEAWDLARKANQLVNAGDEPTLHAEQVQGRKLDTWDMPYGTTKGPAPIGENPEVGGPAGEPNPPGEEGLLGAQSEEAQQAPELPPAASQGIDFASPNIRDDMSFNTAKKALKGKEHATVRDYSDRLESDLANQYGYQPAQNHDTIGDYQETAENTLMTPHVGQAQAHRRLALALKGLHGGQKQVLSFRHDDTGEHYLYSLKFNHDKAEAVRDLLDKQKIKYRTMEPAEKGQPVGVHLVDFDGSIEPKLEKLFKQGHIRDAHAYRGNAELIGDENSRERAAQAYRGILQEARDQAAQGAAGGRGLHGGEAWFEPHAREAEENFQRLRQNEDFEKQEIDNDHREAGTDRDQIPPNQDRELRRLNRIGKRLVAEDPEMAKLDPRTNHAYKLGQKNFPRSDMSNSDVGEYFDQEHKPLDLINNPKHREEAAHIYYQDLIHSLAGTANGGKPSTAYGWYDRTVGKTVNKMGEVAPEILTNPDSELAFKLALAATSQGQEVNPNAESSWHAYQYWKKHGKLPEDVRNFGDGQKYTQMEGNFRKLNELWDKHGSDWLRDFLQEKATVGELKEKHGLSVAGENVGHKVRGAMFMGPKVGAFFSNLMGHFDPVTMDMWWSRDFNKIAGNMFNFSEDAMKKGSAKIHPQLDDLEDLLDNYPHIAPSEERHMPHPEGLLAATPEDIDKMKEEVAKLRAIPAGEMSRKTAQDAAPTVFQWAKKATRNYARSYGEKEGPLKRSFHEDFKTPENNLGKRMWENVNKLSDAPRGAAERNAWREVTGLVEQKLKKQGIRLTNADKQALGWFNIKDLFALAGANSVRNADYLDAAYTLTRRIKNGDLPDLTDA